MHDLVTKVNQGNKKSFCCFQQLEQLPSMQSIEQKRGVSISEKLS